MYMNQVVKLPIYKSLNDVSVLPLYLYILYTMFANVFKFELTISALYPVNQDAETADPQTREFLLKVVDILLDFITKTNDREEKVLDFKHPIELNRMLDLELPEKPQPIGKLLEDCKSALEHQVKTGN